MILGADQCSKSALSSASSSSWKARTGSGGGSTRKLIGAPFGLRAMSTRPTGPSNALWFWLARQARSRMSPGSPSHACALAGTDFGGIRPGLVVVDVVLGALLRRGELVELLELRGDGLGPA